MKFNYRFITQFMKKNNITKYDLAEKCNIDHSVFRTMKKGNPVKLTTLVSISKAMNVPIDNLFNVIDCDVDRVIKEEKEYDKAIIEVFNALIKSGLSETKANSLLIRLLEEEAELYVKAQKAIK